MPFRRGQTVSEPLAPLQATRPEVNDRSSTIDARVLGLVRSRTGGTDTEIVRAFETSETFRSLCADLGTCFRALARWQYSDAPEAPHRVAEYGGLIDELASEIRNLLAEEARSPEDRPV